MPILALGMMWLVLTIMEHLSITEESGRLATVGSAGRERADRSFRFPNNSITATTVGVLPQKLQERITQYDFLTFDLLNQLLSFQ